MRNRVIASWLLLTLLLHPAPDAFAATNGDARQVMAGATAPALVADGRLDGITLDAVILSEAEHAFLRTHPIITLGAEATWEPYIVVAPDGRIGGYDADILALINRATGADIRLHAGSWRAVLESTRTRELDGFTTGAPHVERSSFVSFSDVYLALEKVVLVPTGNPARIRSESDLSGKRIGLHKGNLQDEKIAQRFTNSTIVPMDSFDDTIRAAVTGEVDAILGNGATQHRANRLGLPFLQMAIPLNERLDLVFSVRTDWPEAISIINKGLAAIPQQVRAQLQNYWFLGTASSDKQMLPLTPGEGLYLEHKAQLHYCIDPDAMPLEGINESDKHIGITSDLVALLAQRIGIRFALVPTASKAASMEAINARHCDLMPATVATTDGHESFAYTEPVLAFPLVIATHSSELFVARLQDIGDRPVGVLHDDPAIATVRAIYPEIRLVEVSNIRDGLEQVESRRLFGFLGIIPAISYEIQRAGTLNVKIGGRFDERIEFSVAVRNDEPQLLAIVRKAIAGITPEEWDGMTHDWLKVRYEQERDLTVVWQILGMLAALALYRDLELRRFNRELTRLNSELQQLYRTDRLTGIANRHLLEEQIRHEVDRARRYGQIFSVIMLDIDRFKDINDTRGHAAGDVILKEVGALLAAQTRASDTVGRWGGEEFLLICTASELEGAVQLAESLRMHIRTTLQSNSEPVTASFGVAQYRPGESPDAIIQRADLAMYAAKSAGRDRVEKAPDAQA